MKIESFVAYIFNIRSSIMAHGTIEIESKYDIKHENSYELGMMGEEKMDCDVRDAA